ncbi:MAG: 5'/3'-nucleotidase SurE [Gemmatimonadales bacterium]
MHILVVNDDGILSPGIQVLAEACQTVAHVTVVAPDREQSAQSHALTLTRPLRPVARPDGSWQVDGTPTDCVLLALEALMPEQPAFVFSGINHGPNMGEDVLYSGTVSAAMEAVVLGIPGVAISFAGRREDLLAGLRTNPREAGPAHHDPRRVPAQHAAQHQSPRDPGRRSEGDQGGPARLARLRGVRGPAEGSLGPRGLLDRWRDDHLERRCRHRPRRRGRGLHRRDAVAARPHEPHPPRDGPRMATGGVA